MTILILQLHRGARTPMTARTPGGVFLTRSLDALRDLSAIEELPR